MDLNTCKPKIVEPWNKGRLVGQKLPLKLREIWGIRIRLQLSERCRDLALFNLAIDSKLRGCNLVSLRVKDVAQGRRIFHLAIVMQRKTSRPVQFEITEQTRQSVLTWIDRRKLSGCQYLFPSRLNDSPHLSTRQYARIVAKWVESIGLDATAYGTHSMRRTKATFIYRRTKNLRAVQLLLGHTKLESTVRYLGSKSMMLFRLRSRQRFNLNAQPTAAGSYRSAAVGQKRKFADGMFLGFSEGKA